MKTHHNSELEKEGGDLSYKPEPLQIEPQILSSDNLNITTQKSSALECPTKDPGTPILGPQPGDGDAVSWKGLAFSLVANLSYSLTSPIVKMIYLHNPAISAYEILFWKSISMMVFNYCFVRSHGVFVMDVPSKYRRIIVFRALVGFWGIQGMWGSVKYMPVSTAGCIFFTMPIWVAVIAFFFLKENLTKFDVFSLMMAFIGVIVINKPWSS